MTPGIFKVLMILLTVVLFYLIFYPLYYSLRFGKKKQKLLSFKLGIKYFVFNILVWCSFAGLQSIYIHYTGRVDYSVSLLLCFLPCMIMYFINQGLKTRMSVTGEGPSEKAKD